jgi:hypothetical protein
VRKKTIASPLAVAVAVLFATGLALAKTERAAVDISHMSRVGSVTTLAPGSYTMELKADQSTPKVIFYRNGKLVAETTANIVQEAKKSANTEITYDMRDKERPVITSILPQGWKQRLVFPSENDTTQASQ